MSINCVNDGQCVTEKVNASQRVMVNVDVGQRISNFAKIRQKMISRSSITIRIPDEDDQFKVNSTIRAKFRNLHINFNPRF